MDLCPKFVRLLSRTDCISDELIVPHVFCLAYGDAIPSTMKLVIRNGYEIWLEFDKVNEMLIGMKEFFKEFSLRGGQTLVFHYDVAYVFNVWIVGVDACEIEYPPFIRHAQSTEGVKGCSLDSGWIFVCHLNCATTVVNEVVVPHSFVDRIGSIIPNRLEFYISGGYHFVGSYRPNGKVTGMGTLSNMLGAADYRSLNVLVFRYDGDSRFNVTAYDACMTETPVSPKPPCSHKFVPNSTAFEIVVKPFHMLPHNHGVDIPVKFSNVLLTWCRIGYITAYNGSCCWCLQIRKRRHSKRTTINVGWVEFRDDLKLEVGDVCAFEWKNDTMNNFNIRIVKNGCSVV